MVDLPGLQPHLAGDERAVGVAISAVVTSRVKDVHPADDDEIYLVPVAGSRLSPKGYVYLLTREIRSSDAEAVVATNLEQSLSVIVHAAMPW